MLNSTKEDLEERSCVAPKRDSGLQDSASGKILNVNRGCDEG